MNTSIVGGYTGKLLVVDLGKQKYEIQKLDPEAARTLIGGYGIGVWFIYQNQRPMVDPMGPDNWLGFTTGPLTGSAIPSGTRWSVVTKSPLTGTWGDANASGWFGRALKAAGFDAVFCRGISHRPVILLIQDGVVSFKDASHLWGADTYDTEDALKQSYSRQAHIACIGPAGENRCLISGIVHAKSRVAARSGVGAVMGAKKLKAVVALGSGEVPTGPATPSTKKRYVQQILDGVGFSEFYRTTGTPGAIVGGVETADSPIKNWSGTPDDFVDVDQISAAAMYGPGRKKRTCWACPIGCWSDVYQGERLVPQPEYETAAAFGSLQLVSDLQSVLKSNDLCNRYGLDTISAGSTIAFAMEIFERGIIDVNDIGFPLNWGDGAAAVRLVEQMAFRQGFGAVLADGSQRAAQLIGPDAEPFAMHIMGQDLPMHDPRLEPGLGLVYVADATPGRHNQANCFIAPEGLEIGYPGFAQEVGDQIGRGTFMKPLGCLFHALQASGACQFGYLATTFDFVNQSLSAVTGHTYSLEDVLLCGERIAVLRQAFNLREGINLLKFQIPARAYGKPPLTKGPVAGVTVELAQLLGEYMEVMDWSPDKAVPSQERLHDLGLDFLIFRIFTRVTARLESRQLIYTRITATI